MAVIALVALLTFPAGSAAATFTVNTAADTNDVSDTNDICDAQACSLHEAIGAANGAAGADTIAFSIPGTGPHTIQPLSALPAVTGEVTIDGTTEPDYAGAPVVELSGASVLTSARWLRISAGNSAVKGLALNRWRDTDRAPAWLDALTGPPHRASPHRHCRESGDDGDDDKGPGDRAGRVLPVGPCTERQGMGDTKAATKPPPSASVRRGARRSARPASQAAMSRPAYPANEIAQAYSGTPPGPSVGTCWRATWSRVVEKEQGEENEVYEDEPPRRIAREGCRGAPGEDATGAGGGGYAACFLRCARGLFRVRMAKTEGPPT
jgi:CSLREA domain-containing protein